MLRGQGARWPWRHSLAGQTWLRRYRCLTEAAMKSISRSKPEVWRVWAISDGDDIAEDKASQRQITRCPQLLASAMSAYGRLPAKIRC
mmetsp:Transcript_33471/g.73232  ORF Transcript_33471/g.73232 Transcript_33471/m.73232 type:complete len:88 (-) Transcript_33471:68-331(-)